MQRVHGFALFLFVPLHLAAHPGAGIVADVQGRIYFTHGPSVVMLETNGVARVIVHDASHEKFYQLHHIQRTPDGGWVTASDVGDALWRFTADRTLTRYYPPPNADRALRVGLGGDPFALDRNGNVYAVNSAPSRFTQILKVTPQGQIVELAGGDWGFADGRGREARLGDLHSSTMLVLPDGNLLLTDNQTRVRQITPDGVVTTLAGGNEEGYVDGPGDRARFDGAHGLAVDADGNVFVTEIPASASNSGRIRKIARDGHVTTFAGTGRRGFVDGPMHEASFAGPTGLVIAPGGDMLVLEPGGPRVRRIVNGQVITILKRLP